MRESSWHVASDVDDRYLSAATYGKLHAANSSETEERSHMFIIVCRPDQSQFRLVEVLTFERLPSRHPNNLTVVGISPFGILTNATRSEY
jgi:hypothetical protein